MTKSGLKTFVCSFVLSLFVIFSINGVFLRESLKKQSNLKISHQNITLFLKKETADVQPFHTKEIKKIALSLPPKAVETPPIEENIPLVTASAEVEENALIPLYASDLKESNAKISNFAEAGKIGLEAENTLAGSGIFSKEITAAEPEAAKKIALKEELKEKVKIAALNTAPSVSKAPAAKDMQIAETVTENYQQLMKQPVPAAQILPRAAKNSANSPLSEPAQKQPSKVSPAEIKLAEASLPSQKQKVQTGEPLIPLEKSSLVGKNADKEIKLAQGTSAEDGLETHIALTDAKTPIASLKAEQLKNPSESEKKWVSMREKKIRDGSADTPWIAAKAIEHPLNQLLTQEKFFKESKQENENIKKSVQLDDPIKNRKHLTNDYELQLASKTVDNILIPIPKEILEDETLTPKLVSSEDELSKEKEAELEQKYKEEQMELDEAQKEAEAAAKISAPKQTPLPKEESSIFDSLNSIFSSADSNVRPPEEEKSEENSLSSKVKKWKSKFGKNKPQRILPVEMRLSFQPNRAEISGQTLRWIKAFANKTKQDDATALEIRIDGTSFQDLQQKRLSLLHNILAHDGVAQAKINTVFTEREPNSFIIRTIKVNNNLKSGNREGNKQINQPGQYLQW